MVLKQEERAEEGDGDALAMASMSSAAMVPMAVALAQDPHLKSKHGAARWGRKGSAWCSCWCNELSGG